MADTKQFTEESDALKQFMELLNQQNMKEQSQDFMSAGGNIRTNFLKKDIPLIHSGTR